MRGMVLTALFAALICVGAFIRLPISPVAVTLQSFFVLLAGILLGAKRGAAAVIIYIFIGLLGIPVFTMGGGFAYVLQPTFGFILGMALCAFISGFAAKKSVSLVRYIVAALLGVAAIYAVGVPYLCAIMCLYLKIDISEVLTYSLAIMLLKDAVAAIVAAVVAYEVKKAVKA